MASLNMANMNTLFKKGYLLAGVVIAANMFVVNEMKAMNYKGAQEGNSIDEIVNDMYYNKEKTKTGQQGQQQNSDQNSNQDSNIENENPGVQFLDSLLSWENTINLVGGLAFSVANNYFKWWNYDAGIYCWEFGCLGWRTKRFLNGMLQFDININLGRGILWLIPGAYFFIKGCVSKANESDGEVYFKALHVSFFIVANLLYNRFDEVYLAMTAGIAIFLLQGFVSAPLTFHISKFSISISLDSIIFGIVGMILEPNGNSIAGQFKVNYNSDDEK